MNDQNVSLEYLGITEAAEYLRVSASTLRRWEKKGFLIPERTPTGIRRYTKSQLDAVLQQSVPTDFDSDSYTSVSEYEQVSPSQSDEYSFTDNNVYTTNDSQPSTYTEYTTESYSTSYSNVEPVEEVTSHYSAAPINNNEFAISSHRQSPPPRYQDSAISSSQQNYTDNSYPRFSSSFSYPTDPVQESLNQLSHAEVESPTYYPYTSMEYPSNAIYAEEDNAPEHTQSFSSIQEEELLPDLREKSMISNKLNTKQEKKNESTRTKRSSGVALFMGVFVGILLLTASVWFGYIYLSGGFSTHALLSPVP